MYDQLLNMEKNCMKKAKEDVDVFVDCMKDKSKGIE
jgi:hypothetical protein